MNLNLPLCLLSGAALFGCAGVPSHFASEDKGSLELELRTAPSDTRCLTVSISASRQVSHQLALEAGKSISVRLDRLPTGLANVDARAYGEDCSAITESSLPLFVSESPVTTNIRPNVVAKVVLKLIRNGRLSADVDFEAGPKGSDEKALLAVIGDTPYGAAQVKDVAKLVDAINSDPEVERVVHVGDIKNGSTVCDTSYFNYIYDQFSRFIRPLHYTPGDNEWTDCHRASNGAYNPLERLSTLRSIFFSSPGTTFNVFSPVLSQATVPAHSAFVENQLWAESGVIFATLHVVGSENGYLPWYTDDKTGKYQDDPALRTAEVEARIAASIDWLNRAFDVASSDEAKGVAIFWQADTQIGAAHGFEAIISTLTARARAFGKPVLLVEGDSHVYASDQPFATGNAKYGVTEPVVNLSRVVVQGSTIGEWLALTVDPLAPAVFSWERRYLP